MPLSARKLFPLSAHHRQYGNHRSGYCHSAIRRPNIGGAAYTDKLNGKIPEEFWRSKQSD